MAAATEPRIREGGSREAIISEPVRTVAQAGAPVRRKFRYRSKRGFLSQLLCDWYIQVGLRLIVLEGMSCIGRIRLQWRTKGGSLLFQEVKKSLPFVCFDGEDMQTENAACSEGIQALLHQRPWLSLGDTELYLQGWFQALQWRACNANTERRTECLERPYVTSQNGSGIATGV
jgi:hypothetical protein